MLSSTKLVLSNFMFFNSLKILMHFEKIIIEVSKDSDQLAAISYPIALVNERSGLDKIALRIKEVIQCF